jgi:hypothetical protein
MPIWGYKETPSMHRPNTYTDQFYFEKVRRREYPPTIITELRLLAFLVLALAVLGAFAYTGQKDNDCDPANTGTDYWYEVCMNEGEIDLGADQQPTIEDEAQTLKSLGRVEL